MILGDNSILAQMLPDAMVSFLENHGPEKFAEIFLGEYDTPEGRMTRFRRLNLNFILIQPFYMNSHLDQRNASIYDTQNRHAPGRLFA